MTLTKLCRLTADTKSPFTGSRDITDEDIYLDRRRFIAPEYREEFERYWERRLGRKLKEPHLRLLK